MEIKMKCTGINSYLDSGYSKKRVYSYSFEAAGKSKPGEGCYFSISETKKDGDPSAFEIDKEYTITIA